MKLSLPRASQRPDFIALCLVVAIAVIYILTITHDHTEAEDSLTYLYWINWGDLRHQFFSNHLLLLFMNWSIFGGWQSLGYVGTAELPVAITNIAFSIASLALMWRILKAAGVCQWVSFTAILSTAFSAGYWAYSVNCDGYIAPICFALLVLDRLVVASRTNFSNSYDFFILGLCCAAAILLHQQYCLLLPIVGLTMATLWYRARHQAKRPIGLYKRYMVFAATAALVVAATYLAVQFIIVKPDSPEAIRAFYLGNAKNGMWTPWSLKSIPLAVVGAGRALLSPNWLLAFDSMQDLIAKGFPRRNLEEEMAIAQGVPFIVAIVCLLASVAVVVATGVLLSNIVRQGVAPTTKSKLDCQLIRSYASILLLSFAAFNTAWEPYNNEFWIVCIPFFLILAATATIRSPSPSARWALTCLAPCLFLNNLMIGILPQRDVKDSYWHQKTEWILSELSHNDLLITADNSHILYWSVRFYTGADVLSPYISSTPEDLDGLLRQHASRYMEREKILIHSSAVSKSALLTVLLRENSQSTIANGAGQALYQVDGSSLRKLVSQSKRSAQRNAHLSAGH